MFKIRHDPAEMVTANLGIDTWRTSDATKVLVEGDNANNNGLSIDGAHQGTARVTIAEIAFT